MTTYRLVFNLDASQSNAYTLAGTGAQALVMPPAYQVAAPFGTDNGGVSPAFFAIANNAALGFADGIRNSGCANRYSRTD
jgi:hypothetical protein